MNALRTLFLLIKYNFRILFGGKYIVFILLSFLFFCYLLFEVASKGSALSDIDVYENLIFPSLLLLFYPTAYGIQKDEESKILEIFFCIPNYMYKVWLLRLLFVFIACYVNIVIFSYMAHRLICPVDIVQMSYQVMFVVILFGSLGFFLSTVIKSGNGVAVVLLGLFGLIVYIGTQYRNTMWNILLNPYSAPTSIHPDIWADTIADRQLLLGCSSVLLILLSLTNLRRRERLL